VNLLLVFAAYYFQQLGPLRFPVRFRFVFPQPRIFNNFSGSVSGSVRFAFGLRFFVFNNFSGSFFKKVILFCFSSVRKLATKTPFRAR